MPCFDFARKASSDCLRALPPESGDVGGTILHVRMPERVKFFPDEIFEESNRIDPSASGSFDHQIFQR